MKSHTFWTQETKVCECQSSIATAFQALSDRQILAEVKNSLDFLIWPQLIVSTTSGMLTKTMALQVFNSRGASPVNMTRVTTLWCPSQVRASSRCTKSALGLALKAKQTNLRKPRQIQTAYQWATTSCQSMAWMQQADKESSFPRSLMKLAPQHSNHAMEWMPLQISYLRSQCTRKIQSLWSSSILHHLLVSANLCRQYRSTTSIQALKKRKRITWSSTLTFQFLLKESISIRLNQVKMVWLAAC